MKTVLIQAKAAVVDNARILSPAFVSVKDGIITDVQPSLHPPKKVDIDLSDKILLPGFTNAHCHLDLTHLGPQKENRFVSWIQNIMAQKFTDEDVYRGIQNGIRSLMDSGVTTVIDHAGMTTDAIFFEKAPIDIISFGEVIGVNHKRAQASIDHWQRFDQVLKTPHAIHSVHPDILSLLFSDEQKRSIHLSESQDEQNYFQCQSGTLFDFIKQRQDNPEQSFHKARSGIAYIQENFGSQKNTLVIHANYADDSDIKILRSWQNISLVHCPGSWAFFEHHEPPLEKLKQVGIPLALGTDSLASHKKLNFLYEIQLFLEKYPRTKFFDLLPMITTNALEALEIHNKGKIAKGYQSDLIAFDWQDNQDIIDLFRIKTKVDWLMTAGQISRPQTSEKNSALHPDQ